MYVYTDMHENQNHHQSDVEVNLYVSQQIADAVCVSLWDKIKMFICKKYY